MRFLLTGMLIWSFSWFLLPLSAQDDLNEYFNEGQYFFIRGDFQDALYYFLKLTDARPDNANFNFKVGECYLNLEGKEHLAIPYFEKSLEKLVPKNEYSKRSFDEDGAPLHALFYLGNAYRMDNQLDKALESYGKFVDSPFYYGNYNLNVVEKEIKACERAKIIQDAPIELRITNLGPEINSAFTEEKPVVSGDGNTLVYIRRLQFYDAVFFARRVDGVWEKSRNINPEILSDGQFYPSGLSHDGTRLLLIKVENGTADIYFSRYQEGSWSVAEPLPGKINSGSEESHASFGQDDNTIYLSSNRNGGKGGYDIYISLRTNQGDWGKPKNLGKTVNTEFDDQVAYMTSDGNVLFFSSQGHYNMGGYDIFYTIPEGKDWLTPTNLGYPVNTTRDDLYYQPSGSDRRTAYIALENENGAGGKDLYRIEILSPAVLNFDE